MEDGISQEVQNGSPTIQRRTETSRSLDDAEKYRALEVLKEVGLLIPVSEIETFHGRVGKKGEQWSVNPTHANGKNDNGNNNVNVRPTLYSSTKDTAIDFGNARGSELIEPIYLKYFEDKVLNYSPEEQQAWVKRKNEQYYKDWETYQRNFPPGTVKLHQVTIDDFERYVRSEARELAEQSSEEEKNSAWKEASKDFRREVHEIISSDADAAVMDFDFSRSKLSPEDIGKVNQALAAVVIRVTEGSPVDFDSQDAVDKFATAFNQLKKSFYTDTDIDELAKLAGIDRKIALQLASAFNSRQLALTNPSYLASKMLGNELNIVEGEVASEQDTIKGPINLEYAERYFRLNHIVGVRHRINSATLGREIPTVSFFDLEKIGTQAQLDARIQEISNGLGGLLDHLPTLPKSEQQGEAKELLEILNDAHAKPEQIIAAAKKIGEYKKVFEADAGNWEKFTLAEHTETVLRNFEENLADEIPVEYLPFMRLLLLTHDIGKSAAAARGEKFRQDEYNAVYAKDFMNRVGIDPASSDLIVSLITDGKELAFGRQQDPSDGTRKAMREFAQKTLEAYLKTDIVNESLITALDETCKILLLCDGGAYTSMAVTRRGENLRFRNAPSFNRSFAPARSLGKRDIRHAS